MANVLGFARRSEATVVLDDVWGLFAHAALDVEWLKAMQPGTIVTDGAFWKDVDGEAAAAVADSMLEINCQEAFWCGGPCGEKPEEKTDIIETLWGLPRWRDLRAGGQQPDTRGVDAYGGAMSPGTVGWGGVNEPVRCGYAPLLPPTAARQLAGAWVRSQVAAGGPAAGATALVAHHQRLETTVGAVVHKPRPASAAANIPSRDITSLYSEVCKVASHDHHQLHHHHHHRTAHGYPN